MKITLTVVHVLSCLWNSLNTGLVIDVTRECVLSLSTESWDNLAESYVG